MDETAEVTTGGPEHEAPPKRRPKDRQRVALRIIRIVGQAALVEWAEGGRPMRVTVPAELVDDMGTADPADLAQGAPHGLPWESIGAGRTTPERIADALRNAGIWTVEDLRARPQAAVGALQSAFGIDLAALLGFAAEHDEEKRT